METRKIKKKDQKLKRFLVKGKTDGLSQQYKCSSKNYSQIKKENRYLYKFT